MNNELTLKTSRKKKLKLAFDELEREMTLINPVHASAYKGGDGPGDPEFYTNEYGDVFINYNGEWMTYSVLDSITVSTSSTGTTWSDVNTAVGIGADSNGLVFNIGELAGNSTALTKIAFGTNVVGTASSAYDGINALKDIFEGNGDTNDYIDSIQMAVSIFSLLGGPVTSAVVNGFNTIIDVYQAASPSGN